MSTTTPRLQLKRPDGPDPFKRQDFLDNWNKLDAAPGVHVCTSSSRPAWGAAQAGRTILETDTRRFVIWDGTDWREQLAAVPAWVASPFVGTYLSQGATGLYSVGTITTSRPGTLLISAGADLASVDTSKQSATIRAYVNGSVADGSGLSTVQWTGSNNDNSGSDIRHGTANAYKVVAPGSYTVAVQVSVGTSSNLSVYVSRVTASIILSTQDR